MPMTFDHVLLNSPSFKDAVPGLMELTYPLLKEGCSHFRMSSEEREECVHDVLVRISKPKGFFEKLYKRAQKLGKPQGDRYEKEILKKAREWCRKRKLHPWHRQFATGSSTYAPNITYLTKPCSQIRYKDSTFENILWDSEIYEALDLSIDALKLDLREDQPVLSPIEAGRWLSEDYIVKPTVREGWSPLKRIVEWAYLAKGPKLDPDHGGFEPEWLLCVKRLHDKYEKKVKGGMLQYQVRVRIFNHILEVKRIPTPTDISKEQHISRYYAEQEREKALKVLRRNCPDSRGGQA